jgi:hypothetical protein
MGVNNEVYTENLKDVNEKIVEKNVDKFKNCVIK